MNPIRTQRLEGGIIALAVLLAMVVFRQGWLWPIALFLVFDLSMLGYLGGPRLGAAIYNLVHSWTLPAMLAVALLLLAALGGGAPYWLIVLAAAWAFHVGVDRALGYGLKLPEGFGHTHLGLIGKAKREAETA